MYETWQDNLPETEAPREPRLRRPPFWMIGTFLVLTIVSWIPLVLFAKARVSTSSKPRVQFAQDMGVQPKYREQQSSEVFADGRADRPIVPGTVKRGGLEEDDAYFRGFTFGPAGASGKPQAQFLTDFPEQVKLTPELLRRGQERFNIYCSVCHGLDGYGNGAVNQRAVELAEPRWVPAANLHSDVVRGRADGHIFNTINVGIRNMPGYGAQIPVEDRWAIVAYVRALQFSQNAPPSVLSREKLNEMK